MESALRNYECVILSADGKSEKYDVDRASSFYVPGDVYFERVSLKNNGGNVSALEVVQQKRTAQGREFAVEVEMYKQVFKIVARISF